MEQYVLLNPGPACTSNAVKKSVELIGDVCPREVETGNLMGTISNKVTSLMTTDTDKFVSILFTSSGTGAVESVISSLPNDARVLLLTNGEYGRRMNEMLNIYSILTTQMDFGNDPIDLAKVDAELHLSQFETELNERQYTHVITVHCETTSGIINDISAIGIIAKEYSCEFVVDAMSSAFVYPIDCNKQQIDFLICSSNKGSQGLPGIGVVVARKKSLNDCHARTMYFDLKGQYDAYIKSNQMRFTPAVQMLASFNQSLDELIKETIAGRYDRYKKLNLQIRQGMKKIGFKQFIPDEHQSIIITSFLIPENMDFNKFHSKLKQRGFVIYPGKIEESNTFRLANIGIIEKSSIDLLLKIIEVDCRLKQ